MSVKLTFMRFSCMLSVSMGLAIFCIQGLASPSRSFTPDAQHQQLDLEDAVRLLDQSAGQVERLRAEWLIDIAIQYGVSSATDLAEVLAEVEHDEAADRNFEQIQEVERTIRQAGYRLLVEEDKERLVSALLSMSDWGLVMLLGGSSYVLSSAMDNQALAFLQAFRTSSALQERLLFLLSVDLGVTEMVLDQAIVSRLQNYGLSYGDIAWEDRPVNRTVLGPSLQLLPMYRLLPLLQETVSGLAYPGIRNDLRTLIEKGYLSHLVELPEKWLLARIESGEMIWLGYVAGRYDDADLPLLHQKIDQLKLQQQLQLILINTDPMFFPVVARIHTDLMLTLPCSGDALEEELASQVDSLIQILLRLQTERPETLVLLADLADCLPRDYLSDEMISAASLLFSRKDDDSIALAFRLYSDFYRIRIFPVMFDEMWAQDADASRQLLENRVPYLKQMDVGEEGNGGIHRQCNNLVLLLIANGHGLFELWPEWIAEWTEGHFRAPILRSCEFSLARAVAMHPNSRVLEGLIPLWESESVSIESYMLLTRTILTANGLLSEDKLALLTDHLHESGRWDELPVPYPAMLEGRAGLEALRLSCEASSDWEPDDEAEQTVAEELEPEVVTAE